MTQERKSAPAAEKVFNRRNFLGAGAASVAAAATAVPSQAAPAREIAWDREVDIIVIGAGASGLPAAIAARDGGAEVMVVDHHFDTGGIAIMSGGDIRIGGGNRLQIAAGIKETADDVYRRWTHPLRHRFADADLVRRFADEGVATFDFLEANGVNFDRHGTAVPREGRVGLTKTPGVRPHEWPVRTDNIAHDQARNGSGIVKPLELSARDKGVELVDPDWFATPERWRQLQELKARNLGWFDVDLKYGTVGAVAVDRAGHLAAATSTGGLTGKRWGRIGDSPVIGAGTYADDRACAVSATGTSPV